MDEPSEGLAPVMVLELSHIIAQLKESVARKIPECTISKGSLEKAVTCYTYSLLQTNLQS